jgi:hypothetical protein
MKLTITKDDDLHNSYTVEQDGKICDRLTWDEMIGMIAYTTCPKGNGWTSNDSLFKMHDPKESEPQVSLLPA